MTRRVVDIAEHPADLSVRDGLLVIASEGTETRVPLVDLAVLVVSHRAVRFTHAALTGVCEAGGACVLCDDRHMPVAMIEPLVDNSIQTQRVEAQARAALPTKKRLWADVVRAKIGAQGRALKELTGEDKGLLEMAGRVGSGDPKNIEAQASRRYWPALFGPDFRRNVHTEDQNRLLNYGYAIVRAVVARAVCAAGLHPSLGLSHHNKYNAFCLADDLMEPFRPLVDGEAFALVRERGAFAPLDGESKARLIGVVQKARYGIGDESRSLFEVVQHTCVSLVEVYTGKRRRLDLPRF